MNKAMSLCSGSFHSKNHEKGGKGSFKEWGLERQPHRYSLQHVNNYLYLTICHSYICQESLVEAVIF